jgi:peptidoglycan/LPS O-acetylase OafA/YrhL
MKHIPALDGLRGIAIIMVILYHFIRFEPQGSFQELFKRISEMGYMGVDLFFVLSGFLISGILFSIYEKGQGLKQFFVRRVLRIFPAYFFLLILMFYISPLFSTSIPYELSLENSQYFWLYLLNFYIELNGFSAAPYLTHIWSLSVEEQFYLFFPFVLPFLKHYWHWVILVFMVIILRTICHFEGLKTMN